MPANLENDHNVYILGAGFSAGAGIPVVRDFLTKMRDSLEWLSANHRDAEASAIEAVLDFRLRAASAAYRTPLDLDNVEELFSLAAAIKANTLQSQMRHAIAATLDFSAGTSASIDAHTRRVVLLGSSPLRQTLAHWPRPQATGYAPGVEALAVPDRRALVAGLVGLLSEPSPQRRSTFISFNYDLLVENSLSQAGLNVDYGISPRHFTGNARWMRPDGVPLLKLHGSINWAYPGTRGKRLTGHSDYTAVRNSGHTPVLVPPTWRKNFVLPLEDVWDAALRSMQCATRIIVIGFSMPLADQHFRYLLAAGLRDNISLRKILFVDSAPQQVRERALQLLRPELEDRQIIEFIGTNAFDLLDDASLARIGRSLASDTTVSA